MNFQETKELQYSLRFKSGDYLEETCRLASHLILFINALSDDPDDMAV